MERSRRRRSRSRLSPTSAALAPSGSSISPVRSGPATASLPLIASLLLVAGTHAPSPAGRVTRSEHPAPRRPCRRTGQADEQPSSECVLEVSPQPVGSAPGDARFHLFARPAFTRTAYGDRPPSVEAAEQVALVAVGVAVAARLPHGQGV